MNANCKFVGFMKFGEPPPAQFKWSLRSSKMGMGELRLRVSRLCESIYALDFESAPLLALTHYYPVFIS
jgi:hypothetical protein